MLTPETLAALKANREALNRLVEGPIDDTIASWLAARRDLENELQRIIDLNPDDIIERRRRIENARRVVAEQIARLNQVNATQLTETTQRAVELAAAHQEALIASQLPPIGISFNRPNPKAIAAIVKRTTEQITVRHYFLSAEATRAVQDALRLGVTAGLNPNEAAGRMIGAVGDAFNGGLFRATVIARTEILDAHRAAAHETDKANADVLDGWVWHANLSDRTCISCIAQHGTVHPIDEPGPLDHHQGRCARLPKTKTWRELGFDLDEPEGLQVESGHEWFARLPEEKQRAIMGRKRHEAYRDGRFPVENWSVRKESEGWRDAFHVGTPPSRTR